MKAAIVSRYGSPDVVQVGDMPKPQLAPDRKLLKPNGRFAATDPGPWGQNIALMLWFRVMRSKRALVPPPEPMGEFMPFPQARMRAGQFRAVIDRRFALNDIVSAYRYVETGKKVGVVMLDVATGDEAGPGPARGAI